MGYSKQNFENGQVLTAEALNHIEDGIIANETGLNSKQPKGNYITEHQPIKTINGESLIGNGNITIANSGETVATGRRFNVVGAPQVYTCEVGEVDFSVFADVNAIYAAFDALADAHPRVFKKNGSIGKDASGTYDIKHYTLGQLNPKITADRVGSNANQWDETKYPRPRILINGNIHSWVERHCCYGLYLFVKELLESDEQWALFIRNNVVLEIVPQPNPWGYNNKTNVNANGLNLNRCYLSNLQAETTALRNLVEALIPRGLVGIIDLHNTNDNTPGYTIGKPSQRYWNELCLLASQIEIITHDAYKTLYGADRASFYHMWNYEGQSGINGLFNDYAETKGLICYTSEVGTGLGEKGCLMTKMCIANVISAFVNLFGTPALGNATSAPSYPSVPENPTDPEPEDPETPDDGGDEGGDEGDGEDITSLFKFTAGGAIEATTISNPGQVYNTGLFKYSDYVDVTEIEPFEMSFVNWTSGSGGKPTLGYALYDANKNYVSGLAFEKASASVGNSAGEVITVTVDITDPNVKYIRTCFPSDSAKYGEFSARKLVNNNSGKTNITSKFTWNANGAVEATLTHDPGGIMSTSLFKYSNYVDVSETPNLQISFLKWNSSKGSRPTLGYALYDENQTYVTGYNFEHAGTEAGNSAGIPYMLDINITDPAVKYIRVCWPTDTTKYGEFEAYTI